MCSKKFDTSTILFEQVRYLKNIVITSINTSKSELIYSTTTRTVRRTPPQADDSYIPAPMVCTQRGIGVSQLRNSGYYCINTEQTLHTFSANPHNSIVYNYIIRKSSFNVSLLY